MMILVVDGQGGGLGRLLVRELKGAFPQAEIAAVGTNSTAANAMMKAGADFAATARTPWSSTAAMPTSSLARWGL